MKIAKLVKVSFTVRVIVDESTNEDKILELAKKKLKTQIDFDFFENIEDISDDTESPYNIEYDNLTI